MVNMIITRSRLWPMNRLYWLEHFLFFFSIAGLWAFSVFRIIHNFMIHYFFGSNLWIWDLINDLVCSAFIYISYKFPKILSLRSCLPQSNGMNINGNLKSGLRLITHVVYLCFTFVLHIKSSVQTHKQKQQFGSISREQLIWLCLKVASYCCHVIMVLFYKKKKKKRKNWHIIYCLCYTLSEVKATITTIINLTKFIVFGKRDYIYHYNLLLHSIYLHNSITIIW